jgi:signal peptidase I
MTPVGREDGRGEPSSLKLSYMGPSMNPTLRAGDILSVAPYGNTAIRFGDIVVFDPVDKKDKVVHRVIDIGPSGATTQGDNNLNIDARILRPDEIIGRVVSFERSNRQFPAHGGTRGRLTGLLLRAAKRFNVAISRTLHPLYHRLAGSDVFRKMFSPWFKPKLLYFHRAEGSELQIVLGHRVIGRRIAGQQKWRIRRPFRLLLGRTLPEEEIPFR